MTRRELEVKDIQTIQEILDKSKIIHLGLVDDGMPYIVPMNYGYEMKGETPVIYLHGAAKGYKLDVMRKNPACCFEMECEVVPFEGKLPCQYGNAYYSIIGRGKTVIVDDVEEKIHALKLLMKTQTGKDFEFTDRLVSIVSVIRIDVSELTAKHRPAPVK